MKTLDEVIAELEDEGLFADALEWLKGYKAHIELDKLRDKCEAKNDPLTWDELKNMEGKPVWVEQSGFNSQWGIVSRVTPKHLYVVDGHFFETEYDKENEKWQAYRRERDER